MPCGRQPCPPPLSCALTASFGWGTWSGVENGLLSSCRVVFGAEPSNEEIFEFVLRRWTKLPLSPTVAYEVKEMAVNPKRRQRQVAKEMKRRGPSTKAQIALAEQRETRARDNIAHEKQRRQEGRRLRFEQKQEKAKRRRRGH